MLWFYLGRLHLGQNSWKNSGFLLLFQLFPIGMGCLIAHVLGTPRRPLPTICSRKNHGDLDWATLGELSSLNLLIPTSSECQ